MPASKNRKKLKSPHASVAAIGDRGSVAARSQPRDHRSRLQGGGEGVEKTVNCKAVLAYDGSAYFGWQRQENNMSVQQRFEEVLLRLAGSRVVLHGSSRTDTGVHATGFVATFEWSLERMDLRALQKALNALLPEDIRILKLSNEPARFHARFSAKGKLYRYRILNARVSDPFRRQNTWFIHKPLDLTAMRQAAKCFVGRHNFSSIAVNPGYERTTMVRKVSRCAVLRRKDEVHVEIEADGFLYKMARTMVGTLAEVGMGRRDASSISSLLKAKNRNLAGKVAPAHGLFLIRVNY